MAHDWQDLFDGIQRAAGLSSTERGKTFEKLALRAEILLIRDSESLNDQVVKSVPNLLESVLTALGEACNPSLMIRLCFKVARWAEESGFRDAAVKYYRQIGEYSKAGNHWDSGIQALEELGEVYRRTGEFESAWACQEQALKSARHQGLTSFEAHAQNNLGVIEVERGNVMEAKQRFEKALTLSEAADDIQLAGHLYNNLGVILCITGNAENAYAEFSRALVYREKVQDRNGYAETAHNIGKSFLDSGRLDDSEEYLTRAQQTAREMGNLPLVADILLSRADLMLQLSLAEIALKSAEEALTLQRNLKDPLGTADAMRLCSVALMQMNRLNEAIDLAVSARNIALEYQHPFGVAEASSTLMELEIKNGHPEKARDALQNACDAYHKLGNETAADNLKKRFKLLQSKSK
jgi:tetratricopeptide (TPR) repeat protein